MQSARKMHPITALIPPMLPEQIEALIDQALRTGRIAGAITIWRGQLIDGRARVRCADKTGLPLQEIDISAMQETSLLDYLLETNLFRRHLTAAQRALIAIETSQRAGKLGLKHITRERAAQASGISPSSLHALQYALNITPQLIAPVRAGIISINRATEACQAMIDWPPAACDELVARIMAVDSAEAARIIRSLRPRPPAGTAGKDAALQSEGDRDLDIQQSETTAPITGDAGSMTAPAAAAVDLQRSVTIAEQGPGASQDLDDPASLLAALRDIARLRTALRELTALILRHPPAGSAVADIVTALRSAQNLDWAALQQELAEAADQLAARADGRRSTDGEAAHGA